MIAKLAAEMSDGILDFCPMHTAHAVIHAAGGSPQIRSAYSELQSVTEENKAPIRASASPSAVPKRT